MSRKSRFSPMQEKKEEMNKMPYQSLDWSPQKYTDQYMSSRPRQSRLAISPYNEERDIIRMTSLNNDTSPFIAPDINSNIQRAIVPSEENKRFIKSPENMSRMDSSNNFDRSGTNTEMMKKSPNSRMQNIDLELNRSMSKQMKDSVSLNSEVTHEENNRDRRLNTSFQIRSPSSFAKPHIKRKSKFLKSSMERGIGFNYIMKNKQALSNKYQKEIEHSEPRQSNLGYKEIIEPKKSLFNRPSRLTTVQSQLKSATESINNQDLIIQAVGHLPIPEDVEELKTSRSKLRTKSSKHSDSNVSKYKSIPIEMGDNTSNRQTSHDRTAELKIGGPNQDIGQLIESPDITDLKHNRDGGQTTKANPIKIKRRKKKKKLTNASVVYPQPPNRYMVMDSSSMSNYENPKAKFAKSFVGSKKRLSKTNKAATSITNVDDEYNKVESILANKNLAYGYGDSKNREKVLKFITDL